MTGQMIERLKVALKENLIGFWFMEIQTPCWCNSFFKTSYKTSSYKQELKFTI